MIGYLLAALLQISVGFTAYACPSEDAVPVRAPCYWDAQVQGNGIGASYVTFPGGITLTIR